MSASKYSHQRIDIQDSNAALSKIYHLIDEGALVLDLGCSAGYLARELVERKSVV